MNKPGLQARMGINVEGEKAGSNPIEEVIPLRCLGWIFVALFFFVSCQSPGKGLKGKPPLGDGSSKQVVAHLVKLTKERKEETLPCTLRFFRFTGKDLPKVYYRWKLSPEDWLKFKKIANDHVGWVATFKIKDQLYSFIFNGRLDVDPKLEDCGLVEFVINQSPKTPFAL